MMTFLLLLFWFYNAILLLVFDYSMNQFAIMIFFANVFLVISLLVNKKQNVIFNLLLYATYIVVAFVISKLFSSLESNNKLFYFLSQKTITVDVINFFLSLGFLFPIILGIFTYKLRKFQFSKQSHIIGFTIIDTGITLTAGWSLMVLIAVRSV